MERECEEGEMEKRLRRSLSGYSRRAAPSTPSPTWRLEFSPPRVVERKEFLANSEVSVRKLCADLWETEQFRQRIGLRRCRRRDSDVESPSGSPHDHQPPSRGRGSLRRQVAATDDHRLVHRNGERLEPISPASCSSSSSSLQVVVRKPAFSQTGSSVVKSASYGLGSSTKLLKVLNRICSLEEQNTANMSLVKTLKMELDECRAEIKEVKQREKQSDRRLRKKKEEEEEVKNVFRSIKKDLDDERKVRKQSESLHRKLTRELCEAKHCLSTALNDLEKERNERVVVENLCDEFAKAVKDYEDKVRKIGNKSPVSDKVIVQIAEVWNDQRLQMKLEEDDKEDLLSGKLGFDIETFLRAKEKRISHLSEGSRLKAKPDDSASMHQRICLKELEEGLEKRTRRDNKLQLKKRSDQVLNLYMPSEGDKIHPETSPRNVDDHESLEKCRTFSRNVNVTMREGNHRTLKDKLMEARVESQRLRSLKSESSPSDPV